MSQNNNLEQRIFYEKILNNIHADIVVLDADYRFVYVNPTAIKDEDTRKWLIGKTDEDFFRLRDKPLAFAGRRTSMYDAAKNERRVIEWVERTETLVGTVRSTLRKIYPVFDDKGDLELLIGYSMNVSELIATQEELKTSRDVFQSAFHESGIGMALISPDGKWLDVNNVICELTEYSREELMQLALKDIAYPGEWEEDRDLVKKMLHGEIPNFTVERRYVARSGRLVYVLLTLTMVWNSDDMPRFFIAQAVDITAQKELEDEINKKNIELESAKLKLINKVTQLEELSYIIAHNLRGPAGNIKVLTETLLAQNKDVPTGIKPYVSFTVDEGLSYLQEASTSLMNSLASMMQIVEIKLNKEIPREACVIEDVINVVTGQLQSAIREKQAAVNLKLGVRVVNYPGAYLESILYNFVSNALKYSKPGVPPAIEISTRASRDKTLLAVKDYGLGIDMEKYGDRVFKLNQVFHAGHSDSKGFGLYLTKTQVESLGGTIEVVSKPGEWTEFVVTI
jgi:PAS domain S-box-containing protein